MSVEPEQTKQDPHFELDVVAVLGYQILVVSCTLETGQREQSQQAVIKGKGMEVLSYGRGSLVAMKRQAMVLCNAHRSITVQDALKKNYMTRWEVPVRLCEFGEQISGVISRITFIITYENALHWT